MGYLKISQIIQAEIQMDETNSSQKADPLSSAQSSKNNGKGSKKSGSRPPATAYQKVARQPNQFITEGVLSQERSRVTRAITDMEGQINLQMQAKFNEGVAEIEQQIIGATVSLKAGRSANQTHPKSFQAAGKGKPIDHSQLVVQNSPRDNQRTNTADSGQRNRQQPLHSSQGGNKGGTVGNERDSQLHDQAMNPVFKHRKNEDYTELDKKRVQPRSQLMTSQNNSRSKRKSIIKVMDSEDRSSLIHNRKSTQPDLMHGSQPEMSTVHMIKTTISKQVNSAVETDYGGQKCGMRGSASPAQTHQIGDICHSGQSSVFSVHMKGDSFVSSQPEAFQVNIQEKNSKRNSDSHEMHTISRNVGVSSEKSLSDGKEFKDRKTPPSILQKFENPFNVQSFPNSELKGVVITPSMNKHGTVTIETRGSAEPELTAADQAQVFKVTDLIKSDGKTTGGSPLRNMLLQAGVQAPSKLTENYIQQVMRQPRMTNFERLKRNKTNSNGGMSSNMAKTQAESHGFHLNSQRDTFLAMANVVSSDEAIRINQNRRQIALNSATELDSSLRRFVVQPGPNSIQAHPGTQHGFRERRAKMRFHQRLASQGNATRPPIAGHMSTTTPTRASKKFAGGFGGVGSIYTHSHLTNARKKTLSKGKAPIARAAQVPMHIISNRQQNLEGSMACSNRVGSPCSLIDVSGDLIINGNRAGLPEYLLDKTCHTDMFRGRECSVEQRPEVMSNDTSRSPIPIDEETFRNMNKILPKRMDGSSLGGPDRSHSRDISVEQSNSSARLERPNADISQFTQLQPFIMSPKNLQETLKKQQETIRANADYRLLQTKNSQMFRNLHHGKNSQPPPNYSPRHIYTHQGKRTKATHYKQSFMNDVNLSSKGFSVETSQAMTSKRHIGSIEGYNSTGIIGSPDFSQSKASVGQAALPKQFTMGVEGKSILTAQDLNSFNVRSLLQNEDIEAGSGTNSQAHCKDSSKGNQNQDAISTGSNGGQGINGEHRSEVAIRISKINIAINEGSKAFCGKEAPFGEQPPENNVSELTNYKDTQQITGIFNENKHLAMESNLANLSPEKTREGSSSIQNVPLKSRRRFQPVLKSKTYLAAKQEASTPTKLGLGDGDDDDDEVGERETHDQAVNSSEIVEVAQSLKDDPDSTAILSGEGDGTPLIEPNMITQQIQFERMSQPTHFNKPGTANSSQAGINTAFQNRSRSGIGQSSSYDQDNLAPRLINKSGAFSIAAGRQPNNNDAEVNTDDLHGETPAGIEGQSSSEVSQRALKHMLKFDNQTWTHCQQEEQGQYGFVALKTQEFLNTMRQMAYLDHNTRFSDRKHTMNNRLDLLMKDIAIQARALNGAQGVCSADVFDKNQRKMLNFKVKIPQKMISFKNKSEQQRYIRVANCILALNDTSLKRSQNDIEYTYMKVFRFLADILTADEFQELMYYHVSRFISNMLHLALNTDENKLQAELPPMSLRQFVCYGLDLPYKKSQESYDLLNTEQFTQGQQAKHLQKIWSKVGDQRTEDLNSIYAERNIQPVASFELKGTAEERHQKLQDQISKNVHTFAHEPSLPSVVRQKFFREKETIKRETLARLLKHGRLQSDLDYAGLAKQSVIARNNIVTEHVIASRNMRQWRDDVAAEIHQERRQAAEVAPRKTQSLTECHKTIIQRIY